MATRFRLPSAGTAAVSPSIQSYTHTGSTVFPLLPADASALGTTTLSPDASAHTIAGDTFFAQFVSQPMVAGIVFTNGDAISLNVQGSQPNTHNNLFVQVFVSIVDRTGTTVQRTIRSKAVDNTGLVATLTGRILTTTQSGTTYTTAQGDRIVVEVSIQGTPTSSGNHDGSLRFGSSGTADLGGNDTDTSTTLNPWIDLAPAITFEQPYGSGHDRLPVVPRVVAVGLLTIATGLLQTPLQPRTDTLVTEQITLIQAKRPAPPWDPPNLLSGGGLTPLLTPFTAVAQWELPAPRPKRELGFVQSGGVLVPPDTSAPKAYEFDVQVSTPKPAQPWDPPNLLGNTLKPAAGPPPFVPIEFPNPTIRRSILLIEHNTVPGSTPEPPGTPTLGSLWVVPDQKPYPILNRTFIGYYVTDTTMPPFFNTEWPLPLPRPFPTDLRTFLSLPPAGAGPSPVVPPPQPNPAPRRYPVQVETPSNLLLPSNGNIPTVPIAWPLPAPKRPTPTEVAPANIVINTGANVPFVPIDWPNPIQRKPAPAQVEQPNQIPLLSGNNPTVPIDWRVPLSKTRTEPGWYWPGVPTAGPSPFAQIEWPNPTRRVPPLPDAAIVQQIPPSPLPFSQTEWPLPVRRLVVGIDWTNQALQGPGPMPFVQTEWPIVRRPVVRDGWTWNGVPDAGPIPAVQTEWPLPLRTQGRVPEAGTASAALYVPPVIPPPPFYQTEWPRPDVRRVTVDGWYWHGLPTTGPLPFVQNSWVLPMIVNRPSVALTPPSWLALIPPTPPPASSPGLLPLLGVG